MPHFGSKVIGQEAYDRIRAHEEATGNNHFGSRVSGPPPVAKTEGAGRSVRAMLAAVKTEDIAKLADEELGREGGPRKSVVRALVAEGNRRGATAEFLDRLLEAPAAGDADE